MHNDDFNGDDHNDKLVKWYDGYKKCKEAQIKKELTPIT